MTNGRSVIVIGGGLAGLAATVNLAQRGYRVTLLESRDRLGGRASSFLDQSTGEWIDTCQHVALGCCDRFLNFCKTVGIDHLLEVRRTLTFMTPDRRTSRFRADPWPAPFHLARSFASAHFLTAGEKLRIAYCLACMLRCHEDPPLGDWLRDHRQTPGTIAKYWNLILTSALNDTVDNVGLKYARKVFADAFVWNRHGYEMHAPTVTLSRLYGSELRSYFDKLNVNVQFQAGVKQLEMQGDRIVGVTLRNGKALNADAYVLAVPFHRVNGLLPDSLRELEYFRNFQKIEASSITSVHFRFDRDVIELKDIVLVNCLSQWIFARSPRDIQVVISAADELQESGNAEIQARILEEIRSVLPAARSASVTWSKVISDRTATFRVSPGVDRYRPNQATPVRNLYLAGDWTDTGWPSTMEGAVRSGELAAEAVWVGKRGNESPV